MYGCTKIFGIGSIRRIAVFLLTLCMLTHTSFAEKVVFPPRIERAVVNASKRQDIPAKYIFAMILVENDEFDPYLRSVTRDSGITQINDALLDDFHSAGFEDVYDVEDNIEFGSMRLKWAYEKYQDWHQAYMVYNMGEGRAKRLFRRGIYQSRYSRKAMKKLSNKDHWVLEDPSVIGRVYEIRILPGLLAKQLPKESEYERALSEIKDLNFAKIFLAPKRKFDVVKK